MYYTFIALFQKSFTYFLCIPSVLIVVKSVIVAPTAPSLVSLIALTSRILRPTTLLGIFPDALNAAAAANEKLHLEGEGKYIGKSYGEFTNGWK